jgi:iron complex outermembrane receptor protein
MRVLLILLAAVCSALICPTRADEPTAKEPVLTEQVTVTAGRLPAEPDDADRLPANVTVISREEIERSGAADLAELLALQAGVILYDQTGNGVQTTFDLRGFTNGSGTRVFLDGAPLNDGLNNTLALELMPLEALDRVEITRGSAAALAGGGSEAGVIHMVTRRGEQLGGALSLALGSDDTSDVGGFLSHAVGPFDFLLSGKRRETDGFRENADGDLRRLAARLGFDLGRERRLELTLVDSGSDYGNPGALTAGELEQGPFASPYNSLDFADERLGLAAVNFSGPLAANWTLAANLFARDRKTESLTTGRSAQDYGGFAFDSDASFRGSTVQVTHRRDAGSRANVASAGVEWLDGDTRSLGFATPAGDPGTVPSSPTTRATSDRRTAALFIQDTWSPTARWTLMAGARYDGDRVGLNESLPDPTNNDSRDFSELSLRGGVTWSPASAYALYAAYGEGFLPPTSEELFAFPDFGSNPRLDPEDSRSYEIGVRGQRPEIATWSVGLFRIDTRNEIVFDPDSDLGLFGANINAGQARRRGVEISVQGRPVRRVLLSADVTLTDAEFTAGENDGQDVPLVPGERFAVGLDLDLAAGLALHGDALYVGRQVLDNDDANSQPKLDDYVVVNTRLTWRLGEVKSLPDGLRLFAEARNVLDEEYATRAIYAYDFQSGVNDRFFTPAPGRRYAVGAQWSF